MHRSIRYSAACVLLFTAIATAQEAEKKLPLAGEVFELEGHTAFIIPPAVSGTTKQTPWVWYAPTLPNLPGKAETWMFQQFTERGIAIAGIDAGESYGSPKGRDVYSALYRELTENRSFSPKPVLLGRSRGGLMTLAWAADHPDKVGGFAGIYPVCNLKSYPGIPKAAPAYGLSAEELEKELPRHNPVDRLESLQTAGVPLFAIHGDVDAVVPLEANSGLVKTRYESLGGTMDLIVPHGQGHNMWEGFFQCRELVDFVVRTSGVTIPDHPVFVRGAIPEELWNEGEFTEGVAVRSDGLVFFSDIHTSPDKPGRILVFDPSTGQTREYCSRSGKSNGLAFDSGDRLIACCGANGGTRSLSEVLESGELRPLVTEFEGKMLNAPNDLVIHPDGQIYFSDPRFIGSEPLELTGMYLFRFDPTTGSVTVATQAIRKPNGVEVSPDGRTLYVAESESGASGLPEEQPGTRGRKQLLAVDVAADGRLGSSRVLVDFGNDSGIDGMAVDGRGRIFAAVRSAIKFGIAVYDSNGNLLDFVKTQTQPTNCGFGAGDDSKTLYITAGGGLYRIAIQ